MKDVMGLIFTGENDIHLGELTSLRAVAALPIAGRYRVVDFQLSSMVHSGIKNVGVITQKNYSSLMDHIGSGREWDLHGKQGLVMLPPFLTRENMGVYSGLRPSFAFQGGTQFPIGPRLGKCVPFRVGIPGCIFRDRKSTRLNSSHR